MKTRHLSLLLAVACSGDRANVVSHPALSQKEPLVAEEPKEVAPPDRSIDISKVDPAKIEGLAFEAKAVERAAAPPPPKASIEPLAAKDIEALLARLPPIHLVGPAPPPRPFSEAEATDVQTFALREGPKPPPRTGITVSDAFPPAAVGAKPPPVVQAPLDVVRMQPQGPIAIAGHLSITFTQPMVAVETDDALAKEKVPATLTPEPPGQWRWAGTRTLMFEAKPRFPMATDYAVTIPAGASSAVGGKLDEPRVYRFSTPPPSVTNFGPSSDSTPLDPLIVIGFDQAVDPEAVLQTVSVKTNNQKTAVIVAPKERVIKDLGESAISDHTVILQAAKPFPKNAAIAVTIGPGTPSAEGPLVSKEAVKHSFRTYGPLRYLSHSCDWEGKECQPGSNLLVAFNNSIEIGSDQTKLVTISPRPADTKVLISGNAIHLAGSFEPEARYTVTIAGALTDEFEQKLGQAKQVTFKMGKARPILYAPGDRFVVLDPAALAHPTFPIYTVRNPQVRLRIYRVAPEDWFQYLRWLDDHDGEDKVRPPGTSVLDRAFATKKGKGLSTTPIDLAPALVNGRGNAVIEVESMLPDPDRSTEKIRRWIQVTEIGLDAAVDHEDLYAFATELADGRPLAGVELSIAPVGPRIPSDATGFARLPLPQKGGDSSSIIIAKSGDRIAFLPETQWTSGSTSWVARPQGDSYRFFLFDDRGLYRPAEPIHFKGWIRLITGGKGGDVAPIGDYKGPILWTVFDSKNVEIAKGETKLSALGGFSFSADLPKNVNLGWARAHVIAKDLGSPSGTSASYAFQIEEFRRPEFEVDTEASEGPHLVGQWAEVEVAAKYYSGGPLGDAAVRWDLTAQPAYYAPPNRDEYSFGIWTPWWHHYDFIDRGTSSEHKQLLGKTGAEGTHAVRIDLLGADPPRPMTLTANAAVQDLNQQTWASSASILVHPSSVYVGLKPSRSFFVLGEKIGMDAIRVDLEGKVAPGKIVLTAAPIWEDAAKETCERTVESDAPVSCEFVASAGGPWRITARSADDRKRPTVSERVVWVAGGPVPAEANLQQKTVELVPDRDTYAVGDVAQLMIRTPFSPAEALVTVRRQGILHAERISLPGGSAVIRVPIEEAHLPNLNVEVDAVGAEGKRPAFAAGSISLRIPPLLRTLSLELTPEDPIVEPGQKTAVQLLVKDAKGAAVADAEACVFVVDEAVLALARYQTPDPIPTFYPTRGDGAVSLHLRSEILVPSPPTFEVERHVYKKMRMAIAGKEAEEMADSGEAPPAPPPPPGQQIRVRTNFSPLAVFAPEVKTDREGRARVEIAMPDNLTRYRVMAVAVAGGKFYGSAEGAITAKKALMVRPSPPRFLNFGDRFELGVVVQNQTNREVPTAVFVRASNAAMEANGLLVRVPPQDRAFVSFPARAEKPGTARFQIGIAAGGFDDAAELSLPVWTPATTEAFATYGEIDRGAIRQPIGIPTNVEPSFGALELSTSSTQLQALTDALIYLASYPYGCSEQIASRVLGVAALKDVLAAFEAEQLPPKAEIEAAMGRDLKRLEEMQNWDGGWGFWKKGDESWPFNSIHVMHALIRAREKGFAVPDQVIASGQRYLRSIEDHFPSEYPRSARDSIEAYALYVRAMAGDIDQNKASALIERSGGVEKMQLEMLGWLYPVLADSNAKAELALLRRALDNRATETAGTAHFATSYEEGGAYLVMHSDRRVDGLLLEGLIRDQPNSTLIPKLVRGLLAHRTAGRWTNTQENAWVLLALDRYFRTYEKTTPNFVARAWLGDQLAAQHEFRGRTTERHEVDVPMPFLVKLTDRDLVLSKEGEGRLYYRIGLRYAPADLMLTPKNRGFEVERRYEAVDDRKDVSRDPDGTWRVAAGARVRVVITMTAPGRRYHVALVDPLPAGFEPLNPALGMNDAPADDRPWWMWRWYEHQNLRDERAEAFTALLDAGVHGYAYVARATTVGTFVAPPTHAEEMYAPETFGRGGTDRVVIASKR